MIIMVKLNNGNFISILNDDYSLLTNVNCLYYLYISFCYSITECITIISIIVLL